MNEAIKKLHPSAAHRPVDADRRALYGKLQIARKALGLLDDDMWRDLLARRYGKASRTAMTRAELVDLVEHFKLQGFKPKVKLQRADKRPLAHGEEARKIRALWLTLWNLGVVRQPSEQALAAFVKRVAGGKKSGAHALQWLHHDQAGKVIEVLKAMAARPIDEGGGDVDWSSYHTPYGAILKPRRRVIEAQLRMLVQLGELKSDWIGQAIMPGHTDDDPDRIMASLGLRIRAAKETAADGR